MEQKELSKLRNDEAIVIKPADKGGVVVILSIAHYQSIIIQHLLGENTYRKLDFCIDNKDRVILILCNLNNVCYKT